MKYKVAES